MGGDLIGIGYVIGCLFSILLWKFDRSKCTGIMNDYLKKYIKNNTILQFVYIAILLTVIISLHNNINNEIYNFVIAFLIVDVSNTERRNLNIGERAHFYDSISLISKSLLCGFIAPLFYILVLGNEFAIVYMVLYNLSLSEDLPILKVMFTVLSIIPALFTQFLLYSVYLFRNKKFIIDFKGDYILNNFTRPLLNLDILGAYIESVNFYYYYNHKDMHYLKSYGTYSNKIDDICIKDYLSISYGICLLSFVGFFVLLKIK
jgi:hypothetical protein